MRKLNPCSRLRRSRSRSRSRPERRRRPNESYSRAQRSRTPRARIYCEKEETTLNTTSTTLTNRSVETHSCFQIGLMAYGSVPSGPSTRTTVPVGKTSCIPTTRVCESLARKDEPYDPCCVARSFHIETHCKSEGTMSAGTSSRLRHSALEVGMGLFQRPTMEQKCKRV